MKKKLLRSVIKVGLFLIGVFSIAYLYKYNWLLSGILITVFLVGVRCKPDKYDILFFIGGALAGSFGEIICINSQCWQYANPTFLSIPLWIPFAWGTMAVLIKRTAISLEKQKNINHQNQNK
jgi:uncharacterized membrane protein YoaT (DUF817 family)